MRAVPVEGLRAGRRRGGRKREFVELKLLGIHEIFLAEYIDKFFFRWKIRWKFPTSFPTSFPTNFNLPTNFATNIKFPTNFSF